MAAEIKSPFPEKFTDAEWAKYVEQGRDLIEEETRIQFSLGDLTLKMIPCHLHDGNHGVGRVLERYADEIGIPYDTLRGYRHMAIAWPKEKRASGVGFAVHRALDACPDRFEKILHPPEGKERWTYDDACRHAGRTPHTPEDSREKLDRVRTLLRDDEVAAEAVQDLVIHRPGLAEQVMTNPDTRSAIWRANLERLRPEPQPDQPRFVREPTPTEGDHERAHEQSRQGASRSPLVEDTIASRQVLELLGLGTAFYTGMQDLIPKLRVGEISDRARKAIVENHRRVRAIVDWCDTVIATGDTTMDEQLAQILGGEEPT
ncbi:DUF6192 family protein [Sphaerimonospora mesophila]|uniref:DUF6192 family protein n=1 Tax=Sphaerimonospora mesophila TaxID=37483 RepID=UPI0006E46D8E